MTCGNILFVDDQNLARKVFKKMMQDQDVAVTCAENGAAALELLKTRCFPVIVLDLIMPEMDGHALCRRIRKTNSVSVIYAYTAFRENLDPEALEKDGFDGYLLKTSDAAVVQQAIQGGFEKYEIRAQKG